VKKAISLIFILFLLTAGVAYALPTYQGLRQAYAKSDSLLLDRHGELLQELRVDQERRRLDWTPLKNISPALIEAVIQAEDRRFFDHPGVDVTSIGAALIKGMSSESLRGASTISMQLAGMLDREIQPKKGRRSVWQKCRQGMAALEMERSWSKDEILEAYLNMITFRGELQGIAAASRGLFGKDPHGLDRLESLILASFIRSPRAKADGVVRRASHLGQSLKWPIDDREVSIKVKQLFLGPNILRPQIALAPHIGRRLLKDPANGSAVRCTLDREIQQWALDRLTHHLLPLRPQNVRDGAVLIMENRTGDVLAYVSHSGEPSLGRFVDAVQAKRQAGSTLKPFLYALAFDRQILTPASILDDTPLDIAVCGGVYQPRNYDSQFKGPVTSRVALASSMNVPAVETLSLVGVEAFLNKLRMLGIRGLNESGEFYGPSLAVGSADVSLWELVNAYRTLANEGEWSEPRLTAEGDGSPPRRHVFSKEAAFLVSDILSDRGARSITFGLENPLATRFWTAVKTGTSKDMRDNWCVGYSRKYTVGVWVGNFSGEPMWNVSGISGAAPVWVEMMNRLHRSDLPAKREPPRGLIRMPVEFPRDLEPSKDEWFIRGTEPHCREKKIGQYNRRILYPPPGTLIALDPDIPPEFQRIFFTSSSSEEGLRWMLNGGIIGRVGKSFSWAPRAGKYLLAIADSEERIIDSVSFEVRGSWDDRHFPSEFPSLPLEYSAQE
jgi:penicillin-binding protein 1C